MSHIIRPITPADAIGVAEIYNHYIEHSIITFEEELLEAPDIAQRIQEAAEDDLPYLVLLVDNTVQGYAYASKWKGRCAYRHTVEVTVYLAPDAGGHGYGSDLYDALFKVLRNKGTHVAIAGISLPNPASIALHEKFGMEKVAHFSEVGFKFSKWVDVGYWQCTL